MKLIHILSVIFILTILQTFSNAQTNYRVVTEFRVPFCISNVYNMIIDENNRLLVAGNFWSGMCLNKIDPVLWDEHSGLSRLDYTTGNYDLSFRSFVGSNVGYYDFKYLYGQVKFFDYAGWPLVIKENGDIDSSVWFKGPIQLVGGINDIEEDSEGGYIMVGSIAHFPGNNPANLRVCYRLNNDLSVDTTFFNPKSGYSIGQQNATAINIVKYINEDTYLITGSFRWYGDYYSPGIVRIFKNGNIDTSFKSPFSSLSNKVTSLLVLTNGKIWVTGNLFENENDAPFEDFLGIVRLNVDGSIDKSVDYKNQIGTIHGAKTIHQMANGNIIWGGDFTSFHGVSRGGIAMTDSNGNLILEAFNGNGFIGNRDSNPNGPGDVTKILALSGDTLLVGGSFRSFDGMEARHLVKIVPETTSTTQQNINNKLIKIYPNPVSGILQVELNDDIVQGTLQIFHINGKLLYADTIIDPKLKIDVTNWPAAVYIVKITTTEYIISKKVVVFR